MFKPQGIYADFKLYQPTIFHGENALFGLSSFPGSRIAVICSSSVTDETKNNILKVFKKKSVQFISKSWNGEPDLESLKGSIAQIEAFCPDIILAIGGGSVIDGAKLCRLFYECPYFMGNETRIGSIGFKTRFFVAPTTIGSGAESSSAAVYIDRESQSKKMIVSHDLQPDVIVYEKKFVCHTPYHNIVASGLDAMSHIIEGYVSSIHNAWCEIDAENALSVLIKELSKENTADMDFLRLQYAGYQGGIIQNHCVVGAAHGIAHQLSTYGFGHGEAVALLLNPVIRVNSQNANVANQYQRLCKNAGTSVESVVSLIDTLLDRSSIGERKKELRNLLESFVEDESFVDKVKNDLGGRGNPVEITKSFLISVIKEL
ncbi:MAG: iron-containing alcohol dehydrogenase [Lachnospiraceae bacterium]|nr:iron-containing alcohol dehydrogenase [Lachnospiraceae bacterium]